MDKDSWFKHFKLYFIWACLSTLSQTLHANEQTAFDLELAPIANLEKVNLTNDKWLTVLPITGDKRQYFIATEAGSIYQLNDGEVEQSAFFELKSALNNPDILALTAFTLDPNFHYRDRDGYHTFYTAHTEASKKAKSKLSPKQIEGSLPFDAVIMRWQLTGLFSPTPKINRQHEVMRIAIATPQEHIQQLSFNPYIEPWHDDFGLLFIALTRSEALNNEALYAGAIMRIRPEKYGLRSYTIPADNPFTKTADIANEIVFIAGQNTVHFDWIKKASDSLLIQFNQPDNQILIQAKLGDDWRKVIPHAQIKKRLPATESTAKALLYHGRELKALWGKALRLQATENYWQLQPITIASTVSIESHVQDTPHNLIQHNVNEQTNFSLHQRHDGELLLLEHTQQRLYAIKKPEMALIKSTTLNSQTSADNNNSTFAALCFMLFILTGYFWYLRNSSSNKYHFLQEQWANFEVNQIKKSLSLYKRHQKTPEKNIHISSITRSELLLNDEIISTISADSAQGFSSSIEESILAIFAKEHRLKMLDEMQRKIQLCISDNQNNRYLICLYFRVGNIRHTKLKYNKAIDKAIDWQWLFAQYINPKSTTKRKIKVKVKQEKPPNRQAQTTKSTQNIIAADANTAAQERLTTNQSQNSDDNAGDIDTKLVAALDKLVMMKKQGFLNEHEFNNAKTKILKDLAND